MASIKKCGFYFLLLLMLLHSCNLALYNPFMDDSVHNAPPAVNQVETPLMNPAGGTYDSDQEVTITCATDGAEIHYTTDGFEPTASSLLYSTPISVAGDNTEVPIRAIAIRSGMTNSAVRSASYTINYTQVSTPSMNPTGGTYNSDQNVTISCATSGATIHYTTDGTLPNAGSAVYSTPISVAGHGTTMTIRAFATKSGMADSTILSQTYTIQYDQTAAPSMNPAGATYTSDQSVTISCTTSGATIRFTTEGSAPNGSSPVYSTPISVAGHNTTMTIRAYASKNSMTDSATISQTYSIQYPPVAIPLMNPSGGTYTSDQNVSITCATSGATIHYTTDGSAPNGGSPVYTTPISVAGHGTNMTIRAYASKSGMTDSAAQSQSYSIQYDRVAAPVMNPAGGTYASDQNVSISCATSGATIRYTTDGTAPNAGSPVYSSTIQVKEHGTSMTIRAFAMKSGMLDSTTTSEDYSIQYNQVTTPVMNPAGGVYDTDQSIIITCATSSATIHFTTDGTVPNAGSPVYSTPISVAGHGTTTTIRAYATKALMADSAVRSEAYTINYNQVSTPSMSPIGDTYDANQSVTITCATAGAEIRYTTDGSVPTASSTLYSTPISVTGHGTTMTIRAIGIRSGMLDSAIRSETYIIEYDPVMTPVINPAGGTYNADQSVTITCGTSGTTIRYTTDGTAPNTGSPVYSAPISVTGHGTTMTIRAYAAKALMADSAIASETYIIAYDQVATPVINPVGGTYNADQSVTITCATSGATIRYTTDGSAPTGSSTVYTGAISVAGNGTTMTIRAIGMKTGMLTSATASRSYTIQYDPVATPVIYPTGGTYNANQSVTITCGTSEATIRYTTDGSTPTGGSTVYTGAISVAGHGTTMTIKAIGLKTGMTTSAVASQTYIIQYDPVAMPVFNPVGGTYNSDQSVSITCGTSGAEIRYTTDGSTPTASSTLYTGAITVTGHGTTRTIQAIGIKTGMLASSVASGTYTIQYLPVSTPVMNPVGGTYYATQSVTITCGTSGATIRYTTDGSTPNGSSTVYSSPISVSGSGTTTIIKAYATKTGMLDSTVRSESYEIHDLANVGIAGFSAGTAYHTSLYVYNGTPYVAYQDGANSSRATVMRYNGSAWENVGSPGFSAGTAVYTSLNFYGSTPYVAYQDGGNSDKATVMTYNGSSWVAVGSAGFSAGTAAYTSLAFNGSTPYVAFQDGANSNKTTVMMYNGSTWVVVGTAGISAGTAAYVNMAFSGTTPYVVFQDNGTSNKATLMTYNGSAWVTVGSAGFSSAMATYTSLFIDGTTPYVAFQDAANGNKATVMKYNGSSWVFVGIAGFSAGDVKYTSLFVYGGLPYVAFQDAGSGNKATAYKFNGSTWGVMGSSGFSAGAASYESLFIYNGVPYVAYSDGGNGDKATVMSYE